MKTQKLLALIAVIFSFTAKATALTPAGTFTFANPCQPFGSTNPVPNTYGCFSFSATNAGAADPAGYYTWNFGDGTSATGTYVLHCYSPVTVTTIYTITLAYTGPALCGPLPTQTTYTLALNPPQGMCVWNTPSVSLSSKTATVWSGAIIPEVMFEYNYGDASPTTTTNIHTYANCGNYIIKVKGWDMNLPQSACYAYAAVNLSCSATPTLTGIEEQGHELKQVLLFPNPAGEFINLVSKAAINGIKIVDLNGRELFSEKRELSTGAVIAVSEFPAGIYFLKCLFEDGSQATLKFNKL